MERLYKKNPYLKSTNSIVSEVRCKDGCDVLVLEETVFYPEGGGQKCDIGTLTSSKGTFNVTDVRASSTEAPVEHITDAPYGTFEAGDEVSLSIDWDRRFSNMQRHTGEHLLSGVFHSMYGGVNKGFHMSKDYIAIDIDLDGRILSEDEVAAAEMRVNELIWMDLPVTQYSFPSYEESLVMPARKQVYHEGEITVVLIGDKESPADCIACCGTHVSSTGQIGLVSIRKSEPNKGMTRVFFDCGSNALYESIRDRRVVLEAAASYSCGRDDLLGRLEAERAKLAEQKTRTSELAAFCCDTEYERIITELPADKESYPAVYFSKLLSSSELLKLGFRAAQKLPDGALIALSSESETQIILVSKGDVSCSEYVREYAPRFNGRGGGRPDNARISFPSKADVKAFTDFVCKTVL